MARGAADYKKGLIPGAAVLGEKAGQVALRDMDARVLPVNKLEKILGEAGLTRENEIIVYGTKGYTGPDVVFWILEYIWGPEGQGLPRRFRRLDGGQAPADERAAQTPGGEVHQGRPIVIATTDYVKKNLQNKEIQFLDSRTVKENSGDDIRALRGGYIAASSHVNIP